MMNRIKKITSVLALVAVVFSQLLANPLTVYAVNTKVRQEVNINDAYMYAASGAYATSSATIGITDSSYTSPTYYFEVVASTTAATNASVSLVNSTSSAIIKTITLDQGNTYYRYRSTAFTPTSSSTVEYKVVLNNESIGKGLIASRVVILQNAATLSNTETQIEIGNNETYTSSATSTFASPKYWAYDATKWDSSPTFYAEVTYARTVSPSTVTSSSTTFTSPGTATYTASANVSTLKVEVWGAGGGGSVAADGGGGAGGGAYAQSTFSTTSGTTASFTVGTGQSSDTTTESDSSFGPGVVIADGGEGSGTNSAGTAGTSANSTGDVKFSGGAGAAGNTTGISGGGGGGSAGKDGVGTAGSAGGTSDGGAGGSGDNGSGGAGGSAGSASNGGAGVANALGGGAGGGSAGRLLASSTSYTTSGTFTVGIPAGTASTSVQLWAGGGGGGAASTNNSGSGSGGAGGQAAKKTIASLGGTSKTLVVGAFGGGGVSTLGGSTGGDSTWDTNVAVAKGGAGGAANSGTAGAGNTTSCVGDASKCFAGGNGAAGTASGVSGGGGEGAGSTATGGNATNGTGGSGTDGGDGGTGQTGNGTPAAASNPGGGGAGGRSTGSPNADGGNGGVGKAIITDDIDLYTGGIGGAPGGGGGGSAVTGGAGANGQIKLTETISTPISATTSITLQEDNGAFGSWTDKVLVVRGDGYAHSTSTRIRSAAFTPTTGRHYRIVFSEGYNGGTHAIYNAKIVVIQAAGSAGASVNMVAASSQYVSAVDSTYLSPSSTFSAEFWIKLASAPTSGNQYNLFGKWDADLGADGDSYLLQYENTGSGFRYHYYVWGDGGIQTDYVFNTTITVGTWTHVGITYDGSLGADLKEKVYQDGSPVTRTFSFTDSATTISDNTAEFDIGTFYKGGQPFTDGKFDDFRFWNTVRTQTEINNNKDAELTGSETGLQAYWQFNNDLTDKTGHSNTLTNHSTTYSSDTAFIPQGSAGGITLLEPQYLLSPTKLFSGTALQNFLTSWSSADWSTTNNYLHQVDAADNSTSVAGVYTTAGTLVSGSTVSSPDNSATSTAGLCMPGDGDLDVKATTNGGDIYANRILVQVGTASTAVCAAPPPIPRIIQTRGTWSIFKGSVILRPQ